VGFEALYWIPWLRHQIRGLGLDPTRLIPITRGGAGQWYGTPRHVELYSLRTPQQVRIENRLQGAKTGLMKQTMVSAFDTGVIRDAAAQLSLTDYHVLHPKWMYQQLAPFWAGHRGFEWLIQRAEYQIPLVQHETVDLTLPAQFVAVRFYERSTLQAFPQVTQFCAATIRKLAKDVPVVLLNSGLHTDDHRDLEFTGPNVTRLSDYCTITPDNNLAAQGAVLSRAMGFVGTYGGLAQLALMLGKPSVSIYGEWQGTAIPHAHLAQDLALRAKIPCLVHRIADLPLLHSALPQISRPTTNSRPLAEVAVEA